MSVSCKHGRRIWEMTVVRVPTDETCMLLILRILTCSAGCIVSGMLVLSFLPILAYRIPNASKMGIVMRSKLSLSLKVTKAYMLLGAAFSNKAVACFSLVFLPISAS
mmetsp:Transcript_8696/g.14095  ORF Transcript_8696/g.14095 Transcript_8696/m.14095 type:complete len:107 (-) Transcript_8696:66-386(-)